MGDESYGSMAVGLSFNPSGDEKVQRVKSYTRRLSTSAMVYALMLAKVKRAGFSQ